MPLEDEAELRALLELGNFGSERVPKFGVGYFSDEVFELGNVGIPKPLDRPRLRVQPRPTAFCMVLIRRSLAIPRMRSKVRQLCGPFS